MDDDSFWATGLGMLDKITVIYYYKQYEHEAVDDIKALPAIGGRKLINASKAHTLIVKI